ncbi:hypothetical protein V490_08750 [Pseudogymnoascus sp. VKM F-3557]|nr:hypothetical protein V490_08750 [Pseudogymnoascus sp. VKM F-3557]
MAPRLTRAAVAASTRARRSSSRPANSVGGSSESTSFKAASTKRKLEDDAADNSKRRRQDDSKDDFIIALPRGTSQSKIYPRGTVEDSGSDDSDEDSSDDEDSAVYSAGGRSEEATRADSTDDTERSTKDSEDDSDEDESSEESGDEDDQHQKKPVGGVSKTAKSASGVKADVDDEEDSDDESVTPPVYLCQIVVLSKCEPALYQLIADVRKRDEDAIERRRSRQRRLEEYLPAHVAAGVAHGIYEMPLLGQPCTENPYGEEIIDAYEGVEEVNLLEDKFHIDRKHDILKKVVPIADIVAITNEYQYHCPKERQMVDGEYCCPPTPASPYPPAGLTKVQLREWLVREWDTQKPSSIHGTATRGSDYIRPPDDHILTAEENKKNWLITRALNSPLHMSGYESQESSNAAKEALMEVNVSRKFFLLMYDHIFDCMGEHLLFKISEQLMDPAMAALKVAVANLKQPDLIPSKSTHPVAVPPPSKDISATKDASATVVAQKQQQQSPRKKITAPTALEQSPPASDDAPGSTVISKRQSEKLSGKVSAVKTSPTKSIPSSIGIPEGGKAQDKNIPVISNASPPVLPPSNKKKPAKTSPANAEPARSNSHQPGKAPTTTSKSQTQHKDDPEKPTPAKPSPKPVQPTHVSSSPRKAIAVVGESAKQHKKPSVAKSSGKSSILPPTRAPAAPVDSQTQSGLPTAKTTTVIQCPSPLSRTSATSSDLESSDSESDSSSRSSTPSPPQQHATTRKGKATQVQSKPQSILQIKRRLALLRNAKEDQQQRSEAVSSPTPPRTPTQKEMFQRLDTMVGEAKSSFQKSMETLASKQLAELSQLYKTLTEEFIEGKVGTITITNSN